VLENATKLQRIQFPFTQPKFKPLLKGLWITECKGLEQADLSGLAALEQLRIEGCEQLQEVLGLDCLSQLQVLELSGCSAGVVRPLEQPPHMWCGRAARWLCGCTRTGVVMYFMCKC
jgi:hypothetical protein